MAWMGTTTAEIRMGALLPGVTTARVPNPAITIAQSQDAKVCDSKENRNRIGSNDLGRPDFVILEYYDNEILVSTIIKK